MSDQSLYMNVTSLLRAASLACVHGLEGSNSNGTWIRALRYPNNRDWQSQSLYDKTNVSESDRILGDMLCVLCLSINSHPTPRQRPRARDI